jgi:glycerol-3-phosphate dehydrogenase
MQRQFEALSQQVFDLAIIGGGVQGAAAAREAALRGLKVALVEARDFASGTSSRSSKLIHGGLRYLQQYDFRLVREARVERRRLAQIAPHLARPVPFLLPIYRGDPYRPLKIRAGLMLYDGMGNLGRDDRHRWLSSADAASEAPRLQLDGLRAIAVYHDSLTDDARLTVEYLLDAAAHGAVLANYAAVCDVATAAPSGIKRVVAAEVEDRLSGRRVELAARLWVNAAGPWVDHVRAFVPGFDGSKTVRLTKGTHVIIPAVFGKYALLASIPPGDRVFLTVPWHNLALLGTTDTDYDGDPAAVRPDPVEADYLLGALNRVLRQPLGLRDVKGAWAGLRALVANCGQSGKAGKPGVTPSATTREYRFHEDPWVENVISVCGGKLTTARALGEHLVNRILVRSEMAGPLASSAQAFDLRPSRTTPLPGGQTGAFEVYVDYASWEAVRLFDVPHPVAERIVRTYGSRWRNVLQPIAEDRSLARPLPGSPTLIAAEVQFAIRHEMAMGVDDFLLRRSGLSWTAALLPEVATPVSEIFAEHFGWSNERKRAAVASADYSDWTKDMSLR